MLSKKQIVEDSDHIVLIMHIIIIQIFQDFELDSSLVLELFLVSDYFESHLLLCLVIEAFDCLSKAALSQEFKYFVSVAQVVVKDDLVVALLIVISMVKNTHLFQSVLVSLHLLKSPILNNMPFNLLLTVLTQIINL